MVRAHSPGDGERGAGGRYEVRVRQPEAVRVVQGRREGVLSRQYLHPPGRAVVPRPTSGLRHPMPVARVAVRRDVRERRGPSRPEAGSVLSGYNRGREGRRRTPLNGALPLIDLRGRDRPPPTVEYHAPR